MKRFAKKVDKIFWFILMIFPLIVCLCQVLVLSGTDFSSFEDSYELWYYIYASLENTYIMFADTTISNAIFEVFDLMGNTVPDILPHILSYCACVEICHVFFDFIVFIPRLCHKFLGGLYANE